MGTYEGKELQKHWRISTDRQKTGDEYGMLINSLFHYQGIEMADIHAIIISSVVPPLVVPFIKMCERYFHLRPLIVGPGIKTGIRLHYENPRSIGADRIVNVVGAYEQYGGPLIVIDIGTATTFDVVAKNGDFLGGVIAPGIGTSSEALFQRAAQLPRIELVPPKNIIAAIRSRACRRASSSAMSARSTRSRAASSGRCARTAWRKRSRSSRRAGSRA